MKFKRWFEAEELAGIEALIDGHGLILFFRCGKDIFGAGEDSRVVFARMKNPDDEAGDGWGEGASFLATNLTKTVRGEPTQQVFGKKDLKRIRIADRDEVVAALKGVKGAKASNVGVLRFSVGRADPQSADAVRTDEE